MTNQCKIHARKSYAKNIENHQKWSSKGNQKQSKAYQKSVPKKDRKTVVRTTKTRETGQPDKTTQYQQDT